MSSIVSGPYLAVCAVLAIAGVRKLHRPAATQTALAAIRLPHSPGIARSTGFVELALALVGAVLGAWFALGVAAAYLVLALAAWRLLRRSPGTPCGCLGTTDAPASGAHVLVNIAAALIAAAAAAGSSPWSHLPDQPVQAIAFLVLVGCLTQLIMLTIDAHPALRVAMQGGRSR